jgi:hypothetical protein
VRQPGRVALRAGAGYFSGALAHAAYNAHIGCAIGAKRIAPPSRLLVGLAEDDWHNATGMDNAQVAVAEYCGTPCPSVTRDISASQFRGDSALGKRGAPARIRTSRFRGRSCRGTG